MTTASYAQYDLHKTSKVIKVSRVIPKSSHSRTRILFLGASSMFFLSFLPR